MTEEKRVRIPKTVPIDDDYMIRVDDFGFTLIYHGVSQSKNPKMAQHTVERVIGYYYTLEDALKDYTRQMEREYLKNTPVASFDGLMDKLSEKERTLRETASTLVSERLKGENA